MPYNQICGSCGGGGQVPVVRQYVDSDGNVADMLEERWCATCEGTGRIEELSQ